jgi:predicted dehydrogenase
MWLMGNPTPVSVSGCTYNKFGNNGSANGKPEEGTDFLFDTEDLAMGFVRFDNGACLQVEVSWASNVKEDSVFFELRGTEAGAIRGDGITFISGEGSEKDTKIVDTVEGRKPGHNGNIRHFVDVVLNGAEPIFTPEQGVNMVKILEAIYKSAETGREVLL